METSTPHTPAPMFKPALQYAFILSMISVLLFVGAFYLKIDQNGGAYKTFNWLVAIGMIAWFIWHYKTKVNSNRLTLGNGVKLSAITGVCTGILSGLLIFSFIQFFALDYQDQLIAQSVTQMREQGLADEQITQSMPMVRTFTSPGVIGGLIIVFTPLTYILVGLIISAIIKNDRT